jgi:predicted CoA-binding protein
MASGSRRAGRQEGHQVGPDRRIDRIRAGMTTQIRSESIAGQADSCKPALLAMLEARSVAIVGASARPHSFGSRMLAEVGKSPARPAIFPVNPRYPQIDGRRCYPSLADLPGPVDLVLLGVPDAALEQQLALAAETGAGRP